MKKRFLFLQTKAKIKLGRAPTFLAKCSWNNVAKITNGIPPKITLILSIIKSVAPPSCTPAAHYNFPV